MSDRTPIQKTLGYGKDAVVFDINLPGLSREETRERYNNWKDYESDIFSQNWSAPQFIVNAVALYYPFHMRQSVKVIDVGAGTGLVAKEAREVGFINIDALDPSSSMLNVARQQRLYDNYFEDFFSAHPTASIREDSYDILTASGCFAMNHIPYDSLHEAIRIVKPGGMIFLATKYIGNAYFNEMYKLEDELQAQGKWVQMDKDLRPIYRTGFQCLLHIYKVL